MDDITKEAIRRFPADEPESEHERIHRLQKISIFIQGAKWAISSRECDHDYFYTGVVDKTYSTIMVCTKCGKHKDK